MGLLDEAEKIAGAVVAVEAAKKLDPNANIVEEGAAAVAGYKGTGALSDYVKKEEGEPEKS